MLPLTLESHNGNEYLEISVNMTPAPRIPHNFLQEMCLRIEKLKKEQ